MALVFSFLPASIVEPDCIRSVVKLAKENNVFLSDETCWSLLDACLSKLPLKRTYQILDELYSTEQIRFPEGSEFAVESIRARSVNKGTVFYYVKWVGWPPVFNTWEPESNLHGCEDLIQQFVDSYGSTIGMLPPDNQPDRKSQIQEVMDRLREAVNSSGSLPLYLLERFSSRQPCPTDNFRPYKPLPTINIEKLFSSQISHGIIESVSLKRPPSVADLLPVSTKRIRLSRKDKQVLDSALNAFEQKLNAVYVNEAPITVENSVDSECPPVEFQPIPDYLPGEDVFLPTKAPIGCECTLDNLDQMELAKIRKADLNGSSVIYPCWVNKRRNCCAVRAGAVPPYDKRKRLAAPPGHPVYECNSLCPCDSSCPFRVVQLGRKVPLCVFRTRDRGWGVKTMVPIGKGTFVVEYLGEILNFDEAEKRGIIYDKQTMTYLFDLDFEGDAHYTVDASQMGNISHFINHSCDPNLTVRCVFIECLNTKLPRIALYASRFIRKGEELTFDYNMTGAVASDTDGVIDNTEGTETPLSDTQSGSSNSGGKSPTPSSSVDITPDTGSETSFDCKSFGSKGPRMKCLCRSKNCRGYLVN
ncbi:Histone-lysine N-methyltransferase SUV39H2 [Schistosoma japonicum]|uniref:Histone-lysine N-methyltransferase n=1 Tax=Schistosoma japonicum TaxID=6182 RepID=A0A4Z2CLJ3_SCHJA|nr:Histone-lysine N-methyltransferase SUV39H2 [Schistosoma japonicum]